MVLAILYSLSPIDIAPDVLPIAGWADDILVLGTSALNLLQTYTQNPMRLCLPY
ncbi:YkvA family protein [Alistipes sp. An66]|uniref:YkvA family protein n=1 Tax=Alistipes sp. An66 TaxID=1965650 RepID=UPI003FA4B1B1